MSDFSRRLTVVLTLALMPSGVVAADKLDKDDRRWLEEVAPILLDDEAKLYESLETKGDRLEFQKLFWARRDPDLATPENEYQADYLRARASADRAYGGSVILGSHTDCGRLFILLGRPDVIHKEGSSLTGGRVPTTWIYRDRPDRRISSAYTSVQLSESCFGRAGLSEYLDSLAAAKIVQPAINYRKGGDGRIVTLSSQLPKDLAARSLLRRPRQDFATAVQAFSLALPDGVNALVGLVRAEAAGLEAAESGGTRVVEVSVVASATDEGGKDLGWTERTLSVPVAADGSILVSFRLGLKPGLYTLRAGVVDVKSGKASLASIPARVPDLTTGQTATAGTTREGLWCSVMVVRAIEEVPADASVQDDPLSAFRLGRVRLVPAFAGKVHRGEQVEFFYMARNLIVDPATGKADAAAVVSVLGSDRTVVAVAHPDRIEADSATSSVGPISLAKYEPGSYVVQLKVMDKTAKREIVEEAPLEVLP
jgi:GWxTD domain-containing protein